MIKNLVIVAALGLLALAPLGALAKTVPLAVSPNDLSALCAPGAGDRDALLSLGNGKSVAITVHCASGPSGAVGAISDTNESEKGPAEAAENGVED
jgi:hypothetical protein